MKGKRSCKCHEWHNVQEIFLLSICSYNKSMTTKEFNFINKLSNDFWAVYCHLQIFNNCLLFGGIMDTSVVQCLWKHTCVYFWSPGLLMTLYSNAIRFYGDTNYCAVRGRRLLHSPVPLKQFLLVFLLHNFRNKIKMVSF